MTFVLKIDLQGVFLMNNKRPARASKFDIRDFFSRDNLPLISLIVLGIYALVAILVSGFVLQINFVVVCAMVVLEAALGACLNKIPLWIHGLVFIAEIVLGIMASQVVFMILMVFIYVLAIAFLFIWTNHE